VRFTPWTGASGKIECTMNTPHNATIIRGFFILLLLDESYWLVESCSVRKGLRVVRICK
jgi:hypothetical protein